jgi:hypothetical protein
MSRSPRQNFSLLLRTLAENSWFAYGTIVLLQLKVMLWIWKYRDLAPGDTSYYYMGVFQWLGNTKINIINSPIYTIFLATLHSFADDPFLVLTIAQIGIATCASILVLALLRRLLPKHLAWLIAAWWVVLPVNFDTPYSVHLFSALFPLAVFVIAAYLNNIYGRGIVLAVLLFAGILIRVEYTSLFILWVLAITGYEFFNYRRKDFFHPSLKTFLLAYGLPIMLVLLTIGIFNTQLANERDAAERQLETKDTLTFCQVYAISMKDQGDSWPGNPYTECQDLVERDFGRSAVTFSQAFFINPRAMLKIIWWNTKLIPSATQLALFNYYGGSTNPDALPARQSSMVWLPFLLVLGLGVFGTITYFINPFLQKHHHTIENKFAWLLLLSSSLMVLGILMLIRPQPAYMFPYSLFIMALVGLGLHKIIELFRLGDVFKGLMPIAAILLLILVPPYYDEDYVNFFGYKGRDLHESYNRFAPLFRKVPFSQPAVVVTPMGNYTELCNYFGLDCITMDLEGDTAVNRLTEPGSSYAEDLQGKNIYLFYQEDMIWDFHPLTAGKKSGPTGYIQLNCASLAGNIMTCSDGIIDLKRGVMNDGTRDIPLREAFFINNGIPADRKTYRADQGYYLQILMKNGKIYLILVADGLLFRTNFNQQYLLGNFDRRYFTEVYNDYPAARILKFKGAGAAALPP